METPCIVADMQKVRRNILDMQAIADKNGCRLRPHIKTHKSIELAKLQLAAGACGITCAKISEAEVMASGGIDDIFVAYPLIGANRIKRALKLAKGVKRLILAVDSEYGAAALSHAASEMQIELEIRLEADTGLKRTGAVRKNIVDLACKINAMPFLHVTGIYTYKSMLFEGQPTADANVAGAEEGRLMAEITQEIRTAGINITDISAGSTPTGMSVAASGAVNEIRPGTYIFYDYMNYKFGACPSCHEIAAHIYATVVSTPEPNYAIIDGGTKTFPTDTPLKSPPHYYPGYAIIEGRNDLILSRLSEEHGIITPLEITGRTELHVGQVLKLIPIHICPAVNLQNYIYLLENDSLRQVKVDARGMLV